MKIFTRTRTSGALVFIMDLRLNGERRQVVVPGVKVEPSATLKPGTRAWEKAVREAEQDAKDAAERYFADAKRKEFLGELAPPSLREKTMELEEALAKDRSRPGISEQTRIFEREQAAALIAFFGAKRRVATIKETDIEAFKEFRKAEASERPRSNRTVNMTLQVLKAFLNRQKAKAELSRVPSIKFLPEDAPSRRFLNRDECIALLGAIPPGRFRDIITVFLNLGLRRSELYRLKWSDVDLRNNVVSVTTRKKGVSGKATRDVLPLNPILVDLFSRRLAEEFQGTTTDPDRLVFGILPEDRDSKMSIGKATAKKQGHNRGAVFLSDHNVLRKLKAAAKSAGIERPNEVTIHGLRHSFATNLLGNGVNVKDVQALLRHSTPLLTLRTYCHEQLSTMKLAVDGLGFDGSANVVQLPSPLQDVLPDGDSKEASGSQG